MKRLLLLPYLALTILPAQAFAFDARFPASVPQGSTMEITVPADHLTKMEGTLDGKVILFFPQMRLPHDDEHISRGGFLAELIGNSGLKAPPGVNNASFADVPQSDPHATAIYTARALGIIRGYDDGLFHPDDPLTRSQAAKILMLSFQVAPVLQQVPAFSDLDPRSSLASFMLQAIRAKLFQGYGDGTVRPNAYLVYSEAETLLKRAMNRPQLLEREPKTYFRGFIGLHRVNDIGAKSLVLKATLASGDVQQTLSTIQVTAVRYPTQSFTLPPSKTQLFGDDAYNKTWAMIDGAKSTTDPQQLWSGAFLVPVTGEISMGFGDKTIINGVLAGSHFGVDYAAPEGTPVYAANSGTVVLAAYTPSYGNTVIIDHGQNVFSMYLHMSALETTTGQKVTKGDLICKVGMTGVATGPHLHFTMSIGTVIVNSDQWYQDAFQ